MSLDLFGQEIREAEPCANPEARRRKTVPKGYAAPPGSGPAGETCKTCASYARTRLRSGNVFLKCLLLRAHWTHGIGTDIKAGSPACSRWTKPDEHDGP